jgi:putative Mg2+ transporter-C (MgtC) family protein
MMDLDAQLRTWTASLGMPWEALLRVTLAAGCSGLAGLERELRGREAGLRTTILISVGAALAMVVSLSFAKMDWPHPNTYEISIDPARIAYSVMTGVGLLCAGSIIREGPSVRGLTTAAGLWCAAAIGLTAGMGLYLVAIGAGILVLFVLWLLQYAEEKLPRTKYAYITLRCDWNPDCIAKTVGTLNAHGLRITEVDFKRASDMKTVDIVLRIGFNARRRFYELAQTIEAHPDLNLVAAENL